MRWRVALLFVVALSTHACNHGERRPASPPRVEVAIPPRVEVAIPPRVEVAAPWREPGIYGRLRARGVRVFTLDATDPRFPNDWKDYDAFTFTSGVWPTNAVTMVWWSDYLDGHMWVVVTRGHVYVHSGHDNPNPNRLYWVGPSTELQRSTLAHVIVTLDRFACAPEGEALECTPKRVRPDPRTNGNKEHLATAAFNIDELFSVIHRAWPSDVARLQLPTAEALEPHALLALPEELDGLLSMCRRDAANGPLVRDDHTPCP